MGGSGTTTGAAATNTFSAVIVKSSSQLPNSKLDSDTIMKNEWHTNRQHEHTLGHLDGLVSSPNRCSKVRVADSRKIAAILLETNIVELQRHLLTITVQNQVSPIKHTHTHTLCILEQSETKTNNRQQINHSSIMNRQIGLRL